MIGDVGWPGSPGLSGDDGSPGSQGPMGFTVWFFLIIKEFVYIIIPVYFY